MSTRRRKEEEEEEETDCGVFCLPQFLMGKNETRYGCGMTDEARRGGSVRPVPHARCGSKLNCLTLTEHTMTLSDSEQLTMIGSDS